MNLSRKPHIYILGCWMFFCSGNVHSQSGNPGGNIAIRPSIEHHLPLAGVVDLTNVTSNLNPVLQSVEIEDQSNANSNSVPPVMLPRQPGNFQEDVPAGAENKTSIVSVPNIVSQFSGSGDNSYIPPDDNIAVSNGGYVMTAINSIYKIFKPNSTVQYKSYSFNDALKSALPNITGVYYDPRVIYDAEADRFIVVVLNGIQSSTSFIVVMFSKDNNPADGWNAYSFYGDVFSKGNWADYDNIGISKGDLFITDNLFDNNNNYDEPSVIQIDKNSGYSGKTLNYKTWEPMTNFSVQPTLFTLVPVCHGLGSDYGDTMFFVSNKFEGGTTLSLVEIDGNEASPTSSLSTSTISYETLSFANPQNGSLQLSSSYTLNQGDSRVKQAFYLNGIIHYVFITKDQTTGNSDIVYAKLKLSNNSVVYKQLGLSTYDYVYPSLASIVNNGQDSSVIIGYCRSGKAIYPEVDIVKCDSSMTFSQSVTVSLGKSAVTGNTTEQRWGDYTGMARQYNSGNCYFSGSYGSSPAYETEIAEIGPVLAGIAQNSDGNTQNMTVFPNPVTDIYTLKFEIEHKSHINISLVDMQGKVVALLFDGIPPTGDQTFSFNKAGLSPGIYSLVVNSDSSEPITRKIVVEPGR